MIKVLITPHKIQVTGHANTAPYGSDIVCAAVSVLTQTLVEGLKNIACVSLHERVAPGNVCIEWQEITNTGKALIDTWYLGMTSIADESVIQFKFNYGEWKHPEMGAFFMPDGA